MVKFLLCAPDHFRIDYAINPWMGGVVDPALAMQQWSNLVSEIQAAGADVEFIDQEVNCPDMVFTANAGVVKNNSIVISNFKHRERRKESDEFAKWFSSEGFTVTRLPHLLYFEGCGDCEFIDNVMIGGYGFRSDLSALEIVAGRLAAADMVPLKLQDPRFYHLDTCFAYLGGKNRYAIYYPGAIQQTDIKLLSTYCTLIPVDHADAMQFVCNSVVIGNTVIMPKNNANITEIIRKLGFDIVEVFAGEFMKSGGSLRCLSLEITK